MTIVKVTKQMRTETAHRLAGHPGRCKYLHGHSYLWEVSVAGPINPETGMVVDFSDLKAVMHEVIDPLDHALVLQDTEDVDGEIAGSLGSYGFGTRVLLIPYRPTAENMAVDAAEKIKLRLPLFHVTVKLWETATSYAEATA